MNTLTDFFKITEGLTSEISKTQGLIDACDQYSNKIEESIKTLIHNKDVSDTNALNKITAHATETKKLQATIAELENKFNEEVLKNKTLIEDKDKWDREKQSIEETIVGLNEKIRVATDKDNVDSAKVAKLETELSQCNQNLANLNANEEKMRKSLTDAEQNVVRLNSKLITLKNKLENIDGSISRKSGQILGSVNTLPPPPTTPQKSVSILDKWNINRGGGRRRPTRSIKKKIKKRATSRRRTIGRTSHTKNRKSRRSTIRRRVSKK